ncbi:MAG: MFS transporter [Deltaproteobacteria bacterium]|nr:MFS transporter [Deltaproteobacteria bacterium]
MTEKFSSVSAKNINNISKKIVLIVATMGAFLTPFMGSAINVALPTIGKEFSMSAIAMGWVATSFLLAAAMSLVPLGRIADIYGRKRVFLCGVIVFTAFSLLCGLANRTEVLIFARAVQGIGGAMMFGTGAAMLTSAYPPEERGAVLGINVTAVYVGLVVGPFIGGLLTQYVGWRCIFFFTVPLGLLVIFSILWKLKGDWAEASGERFDFVGSLIYGIALLAMMYGFSILPSTLGTFLIFIGIACLVVFGFWELRVKSPVLDLHLFIHNRPFAFSNLAALLNYMATFAVGFLLSLYLQYIKGFTPRDAGLILVIQPIVMALLSPLAGRLSDRIEPRIIASIGMALTTLGMVPLILLNNSTNLLQVYASLVILGLGFALFASPNMNAVMSSVDRKFYGVASGTVGTMRLVGQMFSMGLTMLIFALLIGRVQIAPEYYALFVKSVKIIFMILCCLCFCGIFASLARGKLR